MKEILIIMCLAIINVCFINTILFFLKKIDKDWDIEETKKDRIFLSLMDIAINFILCFLSYSIEMKIFYQAVIMILLISAYTDYKSMKAYKLVNYILIIVSMCHYFFIVLCLGLYKERFIEMAIIIVLNTIILIILEKMRCFGKADTKVCIAVQFILVTLASTELNIFLIAYEPLLCHMLFSIIIFILENAAYFNWKKVKLKERRPFIPAITKSLLLILLIAGI